LLSAIKTKEIEDMKMLNSVLVLGLAATVSGFATTAHAKLNIKDQSVVTEQKPKVDVFAKMYKEACGCAPTVTVDWEAIAGSTDSEDYRSTAMEEAPKCLEQLVHAVGEVGKLCTDYKAQICSGIKTIKITFNGKDKKPWTKLDKGVLTLSVTGGASGCDGNGEMKNVLEKAL
jgi:hypothetical protein